MIKNDRYQIVNVATETGILILVFLVLVGFVAMDVLSCKNNKRREDTVSIVSGWNWRHKSQNPITDT